jgi:biofilm PGA synthesis lipoprotein PgaB
MRGIVSLAIVLLSVPVIVLAMQFHRSNSGVGTPSAYLEIEKPYGIDGDDPALDESGIPILCYHYLSPPPGPTHMARVAAAVLLNVPTLDSKHFWSLPVDMFEAHLKWLDANGYETLTIGEVADVMQGRRRMPKKAVAITFDDGERSLLDLGLPLLEKYDMKATLFVVTGHVGEKWKGLDMLTWAELSQLKSSGRVAIESHTHDMHYKVNTDGGGTEPVHQFWVPEHGDDDQSARVVADLIRSREEIKKNLFVEPRVLAWPYGFGNPRLDRLARAVGFEGTVSLKAGTARPGVDKPWAMHRFTITARTTVRLLAEMVGDGS